MWHFTILLVPPDCDDKEGMGTVNAYAANNRGHERVGMERI